MIVWGKKIELWSRSGSWYRPGEWVFGIDRNCPNGCLIIELGWWGITLLRGECRV